MRSVSPPRPGRRSTRAAVASPFTVNVRGVSFADDYPANLLEIARMVDEEGAVVGFVLIADTANPVDPLAVAVWCTDTGERVGHLPADVGHRLQPLLEAGEPWVVAEGRVVISPEAPDKPGLRIKVCRPGEAFHTGAPAPPAELERLYIRIGGLGDELGARLVERWAHSRLAAVKVIDLTPEQARYASSLVGSLEYEARRSGIDLAVGQEKARRRLASLRAEEVT
jgi:hypothetical protein